MNLKRLLPKSMAYRALKIISIRNLMKSRIGKKEILMSIISNSYITRGDFVLSNYGVWMMNNSKDKTFNLSILGYRNGLEYFIKAVNKPSIFIDIGANQGVFTLLAAKNKQFKEIHAFEPNIEVCDYLELNCNYNKVNNVVIHKVAISSSVGTQNFEVPTNHSGAGKLVNFEHSMHVDCKNNKYLSELVKKWCSDYFIKIDVEGNEFIVLNEIFKSSLTNLVRYLFVEILISDNINDSVAVKMILKNGFQINYIKQKSSNLFDIFFIKLNNIS